MSVPLRAEPIYRSDRIPDDTGPLNATIVHLDGRPYEAQSNAAVSNYASEILTIPTLPLATKGRKMAEPTREEMKAEVALAEARTDTKIARMEGKLDLVLSKLDHSNSRFDDIRSDYRTIRANIWVVGLGLLVAIIGVAALFPVFFGMGAQVRDLVHSEIQSQTPASPQRPSTR